MEAWSGAALARAARLRLEGKNTGKIAAIHAGAVAAAALLVTLLQYVLAEGIGRTSGLSGMGTRSVLETIGTVLQLANSLAVPFWNLGFCFAALLWARESMAGAKDLLTGFYRFGPYLRLMLWRGILVFAVGMFCAYASSFLYMMTPWAGPVVEFAQSVGMDMEAANAVIAQMDMAAMDAMLGSMIPMLVIWGTLLLAVGTPMLYRFRMAEFILLDNRGIGGLAAMALSARMMRKQRMRLFFLDLRFWWYYALQGMCVLIYCADLWLPLLGISLPGNGTGVSLVLYGLYLLGFFGVQALFRPWVQTAYALTYEKLRQTEPEVTKPKVAPRNLPWDES